MIYNLSLSHSAANRVGRGRPRPSNSFPIRLPTLIPTHCQPSCLILPNIPLGMPEIFLLLVSTPESILQTIHRSACPRSSTSQTRMTNLAGQCTTRFHHLLSLMKLGSGSSTRRSRLRWVPQVSILLYVEHPLSLAGRVSIATRLTRGTIFSHEAPTYFIPCTPLYPNGVFYASIGGIVSRSSGGFVLSSISSLACGHAVRGSSTAKFAALAHIRVRSAAKRTAVSVELEAPSLVLRRRVFYSQATRLARMHGLTELL